MPTRKKYCFFNKPQYLMKKLTLLICCLLLAISLPAQKKRDRAAEKSARRAKEDCIKSARIAEQEAVKARRAAAEALREAEKYRYLVEDARRAAEEDLKHQQAKKQQQRLLRLAEITAIKSSEITHVKVKALVAKEAYMLSMPQNMPQYNHYVYKGLYEGLAGLYPDFNTIAPSPTDAKQLRPLRTIGVTDSFLYTIGYNGCLLRLENQSIGEQIFTEKEAAKLDILSYQPSSYSGLLLTKDGKKIIKADDKHNLEVYDLAQINKSPHIIQQVGLDRITAFQLLSNQKSLVFATADGRIQYANFDDKNAKELFLLTDNGKPIRTSNMAVSSDDKYLFCVGASSQPIIMNISESRELLPELSQKFEILSDTSKSKTVASVVATSPNGRYLAIGYSDGAVRIWDFLGEQSNLNKMPDAQYFHKSSITSLVFSNNSNFLGVGSTDKTASLWHIQTNSNDNPYKHPLFLPIIFKNHQDWVMSVAFSEKNDKFYTVTHDGVIKVWEINMSVYADQICDCLQANLSDKDWRKYIGTDSPERDNEARELYILMPNNQKRRPTMTCGETYPQLSQFK
jgi:WD40 repeat protein